MTAQKNGRSMKMSNTLPAPHFTTLGESPIELDLALTSPEHAIMIHLYAYSNRKVGVVTLSRCRVRRLCRRYKVSQRALIDYLRHSGFVEHGSQYPHTLSLPKIVFKDYWSWKAIKKTPTGTSYARNEEGVPLFASYQVVETSLLCKKN